MGSHDLPSLIMREAAQYYAEIVCKAIEENRRPSDIEDSFRFCSVSINSRVEHLGHLLSLARADDCKSRLMKAEQLLDTLLYTFRHTITQYDAKLAKSVDDFLSDIPV